MNSGKFLDRKMKHRLTRFMQLALLSLALLTFHLGDMKAFVNATMSLFITFLPNLVEKKYDLTIDVGLALWITSAVFFHAVGAVNLTGQNLYSMISWWDHFTHALSASVVAAAGYIALRSFEQHSEEIHLPQKLVFIFILIFVLAFGVIWELIEFGVTGLTQMFGKETILTQHGLEDTMKDFIFNTAGGIIVALFGEAYLNTTVEDIRLKMGEKT